MKQSYFGPFMVIRMKWPSPGLPVVEWSRAVEQLKGFSGTLLTGWLYRLYPSGVQKLNAEELLIIEHAELLGSLPTPLKSIAVHEPDGAQQALDQNSQPTVWN